MIIYVDIDETVCYTPNNPRIYENAQPIKKNIEKINKLYDEGNTIVYWTARGSRTNTNWFELTRDQLNSWGVKYHELRVDKPYYDIFIDDKNKTIEDI